MTAMALAEILYVDTPPRKMHMAAENVRQPPAHLLHRRAPPRATARHRANAIAPPPSRHIARHRAKPAGRADSVNSLGAFLLFDALLNAL